MKRMISIFLMIFISIFLISCVESEEVKDDIQKQEEVNESKLEVKVPIEISIDNIEVLGQEISFELSIIDRDYRSEPNSYVLRLYDGYELIEEMQVTLSTQEIQLEYLNYNTEYDVVIEALVDGEDGYQLTSVLEYTFLTQKREPVISFNIKSYVDAFDFTISITDRDHALEEYGFNLIDPITNEIVYSKSNTRCGDSTQCLLQGLTENETYLYEYYYSYNIGEGTVTVREQMERSTSTINTSTSQWDGTSRDTYYLTFPDTEIYVAYVDSNHLYDYHYVKYQKGDTVTLHKIDGEITAALLGNNNYVYVFNSFARRVLVLDSNGQIVANTSVSVSNVDWGFGYSEIYRTDNYHYLFSAANYSSAYSALTVQKYDENFNNKQIYTVDELYNTVDYHIDNEYVFMIHRKLTGPRELRVLDENLNELIVWTSVVEGYRLSEITEVTFNDDTITIYMLLTSNTQEDIIIDLIIDYDGNVVG